MQARPFSLLALAVAFLVLASAVVLFGGEGSPRPVSAADAARPYRAAIANIACDACTAHNSTPTPTPTPPPATSTPQPSETPTATPAVRNITVTGNGQTANLTVELAITAAEHSRGLMWREALAEDAGMLFIFARPSSGAFWMKNTLIPLDIAYLGADGRVLQILQGQPLDETPLPPAEPYIYTLEVNAGWFERHNLSTGATVSIPLDVRPRS